MTESALLEVDQVTQTYGSGRWIRQNRRTAVSEVSLRVESGESVGIVGESGSGKSTLAKMICGLLRPDSGQVRLAGRDVYRRRRVDREIWRTVQMVFQDPYSSLNPAMQVGEIVAEPIRRWHRASSADAAARAADVLTRVGLDPDLTGHRVTRLSGGQRQRVSIARALAAEPQLLVFDESVSALDVSVQAQILELLHRLRLETGLTYIFISHDIGVIRLISDRVLVMKDGEVVEARSAEELTVAAVSHPYTQRLLAAVPGERRSRAIR